MGSTLSNLSRTLLISAILLGLTGSYGGSLGLSPSPTGHPLAPPPRGTWNGLAPGWTMFHGDSGVNGSYPGPLPWSHFGVIWQRSFANTSYAPGNTGSAAPQSSPVLFNGLAFLTNSTSSVVLVVNQTTGAYMGGLNLGALTGQTTGTFSATPLIGVNAGFPYLEISAFNANTHYTYAVNLSTGATSWCHIANDAFGGAAAVPGGFVQPTTSGGVFDFSSWILGDAASCAVATNPNGDSFDDTPSVGLTFSPGHPSEPNATYFLSDQSSNDVDAFPVKGGAMTWADPLDAIAYGSLALTNISYATLNSGGGPIVAPIGLIADDSGDGSTSHIYALDVNCGVLNCFSGTNDSNTLPNGTFALPSPGSNFDAGVNSTLALEPLTPNSIQVLYASRDGHLGGITATVTGGSKLGPNATGGYGVIWSHPWNYSTGSNFTASPVTEHGLVMDGDDNGTFFVWNATTGALVWVHQFPGAFYASPTIADGFIYALTSLGDFIKIGPSPPLVSIAARPQVTDGYPTVVNVTVDATTPTGGSAGPLSGASTTLLVSGGVYTGTKVVGTANTLANGIAGFNWIPPYSPVNQTYDFTAFANYTGYETGMAANSTTAVPPPTLLISSLAAMPSTFIVGNSTHIDVTVSGGFSPYSYRFWSLPAGCLSSNVSDLLCTPSTPGNYTVSVNVSDPAGNSSNKTVAIDVWNHPPRELVISSFAASPSNIYLGNQTVFTASVAGGVMPYTYVYTNLPPGCSTSNTSTLDCTPNSTGNFTVTLTVTDPNGATSSANASLVVSPVPTSPDIVSFSAKPVSFYFGNSTTLSAVVANGTKPYSYDYVGLPAGCSTQSSSSLVCKPAANGTFNITLVVTDNNGLTASKVTSFTVLSQKTIIIYPTIRSFVASPATVTIGNETTFSVVAVNGTTPYTYAYTGLPQGCQSGNTSSLVCAPIASGSYTVHVEVTDTQHRSANQSTTLTVKPASSVSLPTIASFTATPNPVVAGNSTELNVTVSGGYAPYSFLFTGLPSGCSTANASSMVCTPTMGGNYTLNVTVTDSRGGSAKKQLVLVVTAATPRYPTNGSTPFFGGTDMWLLLAVVIVAVAVLAVLVIGRRKKGQPQDSAAGLGASGGASVVGAGVAGRPEWSEEGDDEQPAVQTDVPPPPANPPPPPEEDFREESSDEPGPPG